MISVIAIVIGSIIVSLLTLVALEKIRYWWDSK